MEKQLIECVPNISEGRDEQKIKEIAEVVNTVEGVKLLDIDPGKATNRTVETCRDGNDSSRGTKIY